MVTHGGIQAGRTILTESGNNPLSGVDYQPVGYSGCSPMVASDWWIVASAEGKTVDYQDNWLKLIYSSRQWQCFNWVAHADGHIANWIWQ